MRIEEWKALAEEAGFPSAYDHFAEGESPAPPFLIYRFNGSDNFAADGIVYHPIAEVHLELYTDRKDPETESTIEALLTKHGLFYQKIPFCTVLVNLSLEPLSHAVLRNSNLDI